MNRWHFIGRIEPVSRTDHTVICSRCGISIHDDDQAYVYEDSEACLRIACKACHEDLKKP